MQTSLSVVLLIDEHKFVQKQLQECGTHFESVASTLCLRPELSCDRSLLLRGLGVLAVMPAFVPAGSGSAQEELVARGEHDLLFNSVEQGDTLQLLCLWLPVVVVRHAAWARAISLRFCSTASCVWRLRLMVALVG